MEYMKPEGTVLETPVGTIKVVFLESVSIFVSTLRDSERGIRYRGQEYGFDGKFRYDGDRWSRTRDDYLLVYNLRTLNPAPSAAFVQWSQDKVLSAVVAYTDEHPEVLANADVISANNALWTAEEKAAKLSGELNEARAEVRKLTRQLRAARAAADALTQ